MRKTLQNAAKMIWYAARIIGLSLDPEGAMIEKYLFKRIIPAIVGYLLKVHASEDNLVEKSVITVRAPL